MSGVELVEKLINEPNTNEILIKVKAASVNFPDLLMTQGKYQHKPELPFGLGMEGAGIVQSVGSSVSKIKEGDEVTFGALGKGAFTELICVNENSVQIKPNNLNTIQSVIKQRQKIA